MVAEGKIKWYLWLITFVLFLFSCWGYFQLVEDQQVGAQSGGTNVGCTLPGTWSNNWFLNARNEILSSWSGTITPSHTTNRVILFKSASTEATNGFETANQWYFMAVNSPKTITINGAGSTGANVRIQANFGNSEKALVKLDANGNSLGLGGGSQSIDIITDNICGATNSTLSLVSTTSFSWQEGFPAMADESIKYLPMTIHDPTPPCEWNPAILSTDPTCSECEWFEDMWSGDPECVEPEECEWNPEIYADDPECFDHTPCPYIGAEYAIDPECEYDPANYGGVEMKHLQMGAMGLSTLVAYGIIKGFRYRQ